MGFFPIFDTTRREQTSLVGATTGTASPLHDPTGTSARRAMARPGLSGSICEGIVIHSRVAAYDCLCKVGSSQVVCTMLSRNSSYAAFGASDCSLPPEGSHVIIWRRRGDASVGWIIGVIDMGSYLDMNNQEVVITSRSCYEFEDISAYWDNTAYNILEEDKDALTVWASCNRPADVLPGETSVKNENNCGYDIDSYSMAVTGGNSFIRIDRLDDEIRMRSTGFTKWTSQEAVSEFDDGGYISAEGRNYSYQGEWLGGTGDTGQKVEKPSELSNREPRPRTRWWRGFLGNLFSWFVVRPRKEKYLNDHGLASVHVSQAGNVMARAAGGISLERYDEIPVPTRVREPWDPKGDKEIEVTHTALKPFELEDPHAIGLVKSSKMAWEQKTAYQRFDELKKDFHVSQESETAVPKDDDEDPFGSAELKLSKYDGRKAGVFIGEDGSVIIRDAWGSEIVMVGGNITINTPGNVLTTANRSVVSIAGEGVVARGRKAAEMSADDGNVRVHASQTVEIAGGTDEKPGGVLIESIGETMGVMAGEEEGDMAFIGGVVIKAEKSGVALSAKNTYVTAQKNIMISAGDEEDSRNGNVFIAGENTVLTADKTAAMVVEANACLISHKSALLVSDEGSAVVAGHSATILNGDQVPILWASVGEEPDLSEIKDIWDVLHKENILEPYAWSTIVEDAMFSFRTSEEALTDTGFGPWEPGGTFRLYEPYWQVMKDLKVPTVVSTPHKLDPGEVHKSKCWPYKAAMDSGKFVTVSTESLNVEGSRMSSKSRDMLSDQVSVQENPLSDLKV